MTPTSAKARALTRNDRGGMTLLELLFVISIVGILAVIALPALPGIKESNVMAAANRQLLDDIALARQLAIKNRSEVSMVFVPPITSQMSPADEAGRFVQGQLTSYRLFAQGTVGDQPGRPNVKYLTGWKELPEGVHIAAWKFEDKTPRVVSVGAGSSVTVTPFAYEKFPYPTSTNDASMEFAVITFDAQGRLAPADLSPDGSCVIPFARGSVLHAQDASGYVWRRVDEKERPAWNSTNNFNFVVINGLTGRARVHRPEIN